MYEGFERTQRYGGACVNDPHARFIPASGIFCRSLATEGVALITVFASGNSPTANRVGYHASSQISHRTLESTRAIAGLEHALFNAAEQMIDFFYAWRGIEQLDGVHIREIRLRRVEPVADGLRISEYIKGVLIKYGQVI